MNTDYATKFHSIKKQTLFGRLTESAQTDIYAIAEACRCTQQELRLLVEAAIDFEMWGVRGLRERWREWRSESVLDGREFKRWALARLRGDLDGLRRTEPVYDEAMPTNTHRVRMRITTEQRSIHDPIFGMCPVQSDKTLCCNLRTIDAVRNCGFACSYCGIQTMFEGSAIRFDADFRNRLDAIALDPERRYHIGTGQSSDALLWGNSHGILDAMLAFASKWPNALLEFKTKSRNVRHLLRSEVPRNIVCSWSLNPDAVIRHEERFTASLADRLDAARAIADRGVRVAFHLHPMIRYRGWREDYQAMIDRVCERFTPDEVVFVSFGALTMPRPVLKELRRSGIASRIHQAPLVTNPELKLTYSPEIKIALFGHAYRAFARWHGQVFFYLCMEERLFWDRIFGYSFPDNAAFEAALLDQAWAKIS